MTQPTLPPTEESAFHGQTIPLVQAKPAHQALFPYFLVFLVAVLVVGAGAYFWVKSGASAELEAKKLDALRVQLQKEFENELLRRDQEQKLKQQEQILTEQRAAHARLAERAELALARIGELEAAQKEWGEMRESLKGAPGREIAANDALLAQFIVLEENQGTLTYNPSTARERIQPIATRSREIAAGNQAEVAPTPDLATRIEADTEESGTALELQKRSNAALRGLISRAADDGIPPLDIDLNDAVKQFVAGRQQQTLQVLVDTRAGEEQKTQDELQKLTVEHQGDVRAIEVQAEKDRHEQELAALRLENEEKLRALTEQYEKELALLKERNEAQKAQLEGEIKVTEASTAAKKTEKELEAERIKQEAEKKRLQDKARSPEVAAALAPFLGKGYWQPGRAKAQGVDPSPISLGALQESGALTPTPHGLRQLYFVGANPDNDRGASWPKEDRLRDKGDEGWLTKKPAAVATARKAQELLNELGPTLVELGLLSP